MKRSQTIGVGEVGEFRPLFSPLHILYVLELVKNSDESFLLCFLPIEHCTGLIPVKPHPEH